MSLRPRFAFLLIGILLLAAAGGVTAQADGPPTVPEAPLALPGTGFLYQGELQSGGHPVNATCDFQFGLWNSPSVGAQIGLTLTVAPAVTVTDGRFTVLLNQGGHFGPNAFTGEARYLAIAVKCPPDGSYTTLTPRQALVPSPLAFALPGLRTEMNATSPNVVGGYIGNTIGGGAVGATIAGGGASLAANSASADYTAIGGGQSNLALGAYDTVSGGLNNTADGTRAVIGGGQDNVAFGTRSTVGGGHGNLALGHGATIGGGGHNGSSANANTAEGDASTIGGGYGNSIPVTGTYATVAGGILNIASGDRSAVGGGVNNTASGDRAFVGGGVGNVASGTRSTVAGGQLNTASSGRTTVGGGYENTASGQGSTVGGGGWDGTNVEGNVAAGAASTIGGGLDNATTGAGDFATVAGGAHNTASQEYATVGGGDTNTASGFWSTVCGGVNNTASASLSYICGGASNAATGYAASIGGGVGNTASGDYATIAGGADNFATAAYSFAAGRNAVAQHPGAFVWAGDSDTPVESSVPNQFLVQAGGGVLFAADEAGGTGCALAAGGGTWDCTSDRNAKANFAPVDGVAILNLLASLPIETWNFNTQDAAVRHMGPMAQDFYAAFGLGEGDTTISAVDADGVALAAIQGLYSVVQAKESEIAALTERVAALEAGETPHRAVSTNIALPWLPWALLAGLGLLNVGYVAGRRRASPRSHEG